MAIDTTVDFDDLLERRSDGGDRSRRSWATGSPFVTPPAAATAASKRRRSSHIADPREGVRRRRGAWARPLVLRALLVDVVLAAVVSAAVGATVHPSAVKLLLATVGGAALWCLAVAVLGGYSERRMGDGPEEFQSVARASGMVIGGIAVLSYGLHVQPPRREVFITVPVVAALSAVHRHVERRALHKRRRDGQASLRTLVIGDRLSVEQTSRDLSTTKHHGYRVVGRCLSSSAPDGDVPTLGRLSDVPQVVVDHEIDVVVVAGSGVSGSGVAGPALRRLSWALEHTGADLVVVPGLVELTGPNVSLRPTAGLSLLHVEPPSRHRGRMIAKSAIDRALGLLALLLASPVIAVSGAAVALTSRGSVFYRQRRIGQDGRVFTMFKLRTMVSDADARRAEVLPGTDRDGLMFKMRADPRITPVGRLLRRFSVDELPQLMNVLRGEMALVGPRPPLPEEYERYQDQVHRRMRVRPGVTGLWQVSGRADLSWEESVRLDLRYVDNWSISLDLLILWKTARAVVRGGGAY